MLTLQKFTGINNVLAAQELDTSALTVATNIDIDIAGRAHRRAGFASTNTAKHANVFEAPSYTLATRGAAGDLVNTGTGTVLAAALGHTPRIWYTALPGGRTAFSNGTTMGIVNAAGSSQAVWGIPLPASAGSAANTSGSLNAGDYQYGITHKRLADGLEGGPTYSAGVVTVTTGGIALTALPVLSGHRVNVYISSANGGKRYFAGYTTTSTFTFSGANKDLVRPCRTEYMLAPPAGAKLIGFWRGRMLAAVGNVLYASCLHTWHLFDIRKDFRQFSADITLVFPTNGGIWVGTTKELAFLAGETWDALKRDVKVTGPVVLGSGAAVPGEQITEGKGRGQGNCMVCIADSWIVGCTAEGTVIPLSVDEYRATASEVSAAFRLSNGIPQYLAQVIS